jgi:hypothetical protein
VAGAISAFGGDFIVLSQNPPFPYYCPAELGPLQTVSAPRLVVVFCRGKELVVSLIPRVVERACGGRCCHRAKGLLPGGTIPVLRAMRAKINLEPGQYPGYG